MFACRSGEDTLSPPNFTFFQDVFQGAEVANWLAAAQGSCENAAGRLARFVQCQPAAQHARSTAPCLDCHVSIDS